MAMFECEYNGSGSRRTVQPFRVEIILNYKITFDKKCTSSKDKVSVNGGLFPNKVHFCWQSRAVVIFILQHTPTHLPIQCK